MRKPRFLESASQLTYTRNKYGDYVFTTVTTRACLFRNISSLNRGVNHREDTSISGIFWFDPDDGAVSKGDIFLFNSIHYRIERINDARARLTDNAQHFYKCEASELRQIS